MAEEPTLPRLPAVSWNSETQSFLNTRKRVRGHTASSTLFNSSDPAVFSSDDDPNVENYAHGRHRKKKYVGSWYQQHPASGDSTFSEVRVPAPKTQRKFQRQVDSGVWMGSDGTDLDDFGITQPAPSRLPQLNVPQSSRTPMVATLSDAEEKARQKISQAIEDGEENIDLIGLGLEEISDATIIQLAEFACIPTVAKGVPFEHRDPSLKLYLANNPLRRAPRALFNIEFLTVLSLRNAQITELPPALGNFRNLETLNLSLNRLRYLPGELLDLLTYPGKLKNLMIHPNPFCQPATDLEQTGFVDSMARETSGDDLIPLVKGTPAVSAIYPTRAMTMALWIDKNDYQEDELDHLPMDREAASWNVQILARSPVQCYDSRGKALGSKFHLPAPIAEDPGSRLPIDTVQTVQTIETEDLTAPPSLPRSIQDGNQSRVLSLLELALKSCSRTSQLPLLPSYLPEDAPPHLAELLRRIDDHGDVPCSTCQRRVIVPVAQWIEWWELSEISRRKNDVPGTITVNSGMDRKIVPFMKRACSLKCLPKPMEVGMRLPKTLRWSVPDID